MTLEKVLDVAIEHAGFDQLGRSERVFSVMLLDNGKRESLKRASPRTSCGDPEGETHLVAHPARVRTGGSHDEKGIRRHTLGVEGHQTIHEECGLATSRSTQDQSTLRGRCSKEWVGVGCHPLEANPHS